MAQELDERTTDEVRDGGGAWQDDVEEGKKRKRQADGDGQHQLTGDVTTSKPWQTLEPQRTQQRQTVEPQRPQTSEDLRTTVSPTAAGSWRAPQTALQPQQVS